MSGSIAVSGARASDKEANEDTNAERDPESLIRVFADGLIGALRTGDRFLTNMTVDLFAAFECGCETLACCDDLFAGHICCGGHQGACVFGERTHVIAGGLYLFVHFSWWSCSTYQ